MMPERKLFSTSLEVEGGKEKVGGSVTQHELRELPSRKVAGRGSYAELCQKGQSSAGVHCLKERIQLSMS